MVIRNEFVEQIKVEEELRLEAYPDGDEGGWSIGYGHYLGKGNHEGTIITQAQAEAYLDKDIQIAVEDCNAVFASFENIDQNRQEALCEMAYNLGRTRLLKFRKMIAAVNGRDWNLAADEAGLNTAGDGPSRWALQIGGRATRICDVIRNG